MESKTYDYIIVGAGSAGCVLANRLSANPGVSVLLMEAGGSDRSIFIQMPSALSYPMNMSRFNWEFLSNAEPGLNDRQIICPRGKVLGGTSSINGMVYVRGNACDFDQWETLGAKGWNYASCLPYFKKAETWFKGGDEYRGSDGPLATNNGNDMQNPLYQAFIQAGVEAGYSYTADYNGYQQEGFGPMHMTVKDGVRWSSYNAYIKPVRDRKNLTIIRNATTHKILIEDCVAKGVRYQVRKQSRDIKANREVILCAGAVGSPHLLQVSGIGPQAVLKSAGVELIHDLSGVGENLHDHLEVFFQFRCKEPITLNGELGLWQKFLIGARWLLTKKGLGATNHFESCAFIRSKAGIKWPDIQYHFLPAAISYDGSSAFEGHGLQVHVGPNKPKSRGYLRIKSGEISEKPELQFNYNQHEDDREAFRACIRLTREILNQPAMARYCDGEIQPGINVITDDEIDAWVREKAESAYHTTGTCKMGSVDDQMAVVDHQCRVRGIRNLRVVDSSIFPEITNGNLNGPTIMVAERAADIILGKEMLPLSDAPAFVHPDWETSQR
ncbi:MAG: choline dehydrogenase [Cohaesibacteraceae bacterium]|nr:choline dehydrogenase [Cohaesibacteraceae bacterium]